MIKNKVMTRINERIKKWANTDVFKAYAKGKTIEEKKEGSKEWVISENPQWLIKSKYRIFVEPKEYINHYSVPSSGTQKVFGIRCSDLICLSEAKERVSNRYIYTIHYSSEGIKLIDLR